MKHFVHVLLILSCSSLASEEKIYRGDINKDGKIDFIETFLEGSLLERKEDLNFDGIFDRLTTFDPATSDDYFKIVEESKYGDHPKRRLSYWHEEKRNLTFMLTQIDHNDDGKWDKEFTTSTPLNQKKENCDPKDEISILAKSGLKAASLSDEFHTSSWGHKIHKSCLDKGDKDWFLKNTEKAINQGMSCLARLSSSGGKGAARNHVSLSNLLQQKNVQVICNEAGYDWGSATLAHATTSKSDKSSQLKHPGISFNPAAVADFRIKGKSGDLEFVSTMFHEQLHNLGYLHGHDVEYPYTCEKCCFPGDDDSEEVKNIACKICSGNYGGSNDVAYLKDITSFGQATFSKDQALATNLRYLKENPANVSGLSYLALNLSGVFDPIGGQLAVKLRASEKLGTAELKLITDAQQYNETKLLKTYEKSSRIIANAFYDSYKTQNPLIALEALKKQAPVIKTQLAIKDSEANAKFVKDSLKAGIKKIVYDVWLYEHTGSFKDQKSKERLDGLAHELVNIYGL